MNKTTFRLAFALVVFGAFYRVFRAEVLPSLPNFSPVMAIAFCGAFFLPARFALAMPLAALFASDLLLNAVFSEPLITVAMLPIYLCYAFAVGMGLVLRGSGLTAILGATLLNGIVFYLVTNSAAWFGNPAYPQTAAGWVQSLTVGLPGYPPTWMFFRNSLAGSFLFTGLFVATYYFARKTNASPELCGQEG